MWIGFTRFISGMLYFAFSGAAIAPSIAVLLAGGFVVDGVVYEGATGIFVGSGSFLLSLLCLYIGAEKLNVIPASLVSIIEKVPSAEDSVIPQMGCSLPNCGCVPERTKSVPDESGDPV